MEHVITYIFLFVLTGILTSLFVTGFSGIGFGLEVIEKSYEFHDEAAVVLKVLGSTLAGLYIFDAHRWPMILKEILAFVVFLAVCVVLLLLVSETPFGPLCVYTLLMPMLLVGTKYVIYHDMPGHDYTQWIYRVLVVQGTLLAAVFFVWASRGENMWDVPTRAEYSDRAKCSINYEDIEECEGPDSIPCFWKMEGDKKYVQFSQHCTSQCLDVYAECEEAFITWANPGLAALSLLVIGFIAKYLQPQDPNAHHGVSSVVRFVAVFLFLFWIMASMAGAGDGLSNSLIAFSISLFLGSAIVMGALFWGSLEDSEKQFEPVFAQAETYKDLLKGLLILAGLPLIILYLILSVFNQAVRRVLIACCSCVHYTDEEKAHRGWCTKVAYDHIQDFLTWDHTKVLTYAVYCGFGYIFLNVLASKFTTLFLSWLIEATSSMNVAAVTGIVIAVGLFLFMLPPIPGIPVYLTAGIVLVSVGQESMGVSLSISYACVVSLFIKLLGCYVQQKVIGEVFGQSAAVRQMVGINSEGIRAMRVVLSDPKITLNKVFVLVGGPDWPVSVLCGILGLDVWPILLATLPVMLMIFPTVLTGSFAYMGSIEGDDGLDFYPWADTMATAMSATIAGFMFFFTMAAASAVKDTFEKQRDKIDAIPLDEEVKQADELAAKKYEAYIKASEWKNTPIWAKMSLILSVASMIGCCFLLVGFNTKCFAEYDLMYTISEHLGGKWYNLVLPLGRIALLLTLVSYIFLKIFQTWAMGATEKLLKSTESEETKPLTDTETAVYT